MAYGSAFSVLFAIHIVSWSTKVFCAFVVRAFYIQGLKQDSEMNQANTEVVQQGIPYEGAYNNGQARENNAV